MLKIGVRPQHSTFSYYRQQYGLFIYFVFETTLEMAKKFDKNIFRGINIFEI